MQFTPFHTGDLVLLNNFYTPQMCNDYLYSLLESVSWSDDYYEAYGRRVNIPRLQAWYADSGIHYSYSNNLLDRLDWIPPLSEIKQHVEQETQQNFNSVLLTYYRDGNDSLSWHADDEAELGPLPYILSLSLGASRDMHFRHKRYITNGKITLNKGDLLLMRPRFQLDWEHSVPAQPEVQEPRINLTFRNVIPVSVQDRLAPAVQKAS
jgi:alkylated DNA repair dioxygenase AlkB